MTHFDMIEFEFTMLWMIVVAVALVIPFFKICEKSGHTGWLSFLILVPIVNFAFLYYLAFSQSKRPSRRSQA